MCVCDRLRQKELQEERLQDAIHEAEKPLARHSDDADLDARLREQEREGDTMLAYIRKKKSKGITKSKSSVKRLPCCSCIHSEKPKALA